MKIYLPLACAAFGVVSGFAQTPAAADPVVLTVGAEKITKSQFEQILDTLPDQQKAAVQTPEGRRQLAERVAELKALAAEAKTRKLDQEPSVKARIALQNEQVLASAMYQDLTKASADDATLHAYYDAHKKEWEEAQAKHILIRFQGSRVPVRAGQKDLSDEEALAKAKELRAKIIAGAKFEEVAKAESDDTGSGENGGDLGGVGRGQTVPEFEEAAYSQPVGQVGEPVKSQFGYHIILVSARGAKTYDEMKAQVAEAVKPEIGQKSIDALVKKANVTYDDAYFGTPDAAK
jgi:peptidyl-prolyl cis-trans isomerase C